MKTAYLLQVNEKEEGTSEGDSFWANVDVYKRYDEAIIGLASYTSEHKDREYRVIELVETGRQWKLTETQPESDDKK